MRRADRLFQIIQSLRRRRALTRAQDLAEELEVSVRTIYRDVAALVGSGVPIEGEAGLGYLLREGYDLPPMMFSVDEIEAIVLGASIVASWSDPELGEAARNVRAKIEAVLPERLRAVFLETNLVAPEHHYREPILVDLAALRRAIRTRNRIAVAYTNEAGAASRRTIRPLALAFYGPVWVMVAWCELRNDFRNFRVDRMAEATILPERFGPEPGKRLEDFLARMRQLHGPDGDC